MVDLRRAAALGASVDRIQSEFENWALAMGAESPPHISQHFLEKHVGNIRRQGTGRREDHRGFSVGRGRSDHESRGRFDPDRRTGYGGQRGWRSGEGADGYEREFTDYGRSDGARWMARGRIR